MKVGIFLISSLLFNLLCFPFSTIAQCNSQIKISDCQCNGHLIDKTPIDQERLNELIRDYNRWFYGDLKYVKSLVDFRRANLKCCNFQNKDLRKFDFTGTSLSGVALAGANLKSADLTNADLTDADLSGTTLSGVKLIGTKIYNAKFDNASIDEKNPLIFEPNMKPDCKSDFFVDIISLAQVKEGSLRALRFTGNNSLSLEALLKKFNDYGFKKQAKEIIYALKESERKESASGKEDWHGYISSGLKWFLFKATCQWGLYPINCIYLIFLTILIFSFPYMFALEICRYPFKKMICAILLGILLLLFILYLIGLIWKIVDQKAWMGWIGIVVICLLALFSICFFIKKLIRFRFHWRNGKIFRSYPSDYKNKKEPEKLIISSPCGIIIMALYFSLISAFNIGWRELNIGDWITRIQPNDYSYKATGWVKVVAGIESLICTYLLALWVLTYFGSPFNW